MPVTLTVIRGPEMGREFSFAGPGTFLIGRSTRSQFQLPSGEAGDLRVSHTHCLIEFGPTGCRLYDLGSNNGTFVDKVRVTHADIKHGSEVRVGRTVLKVRVVSDSQPETVEWHGELPVAAPRPVTRPAKPAKPKRSTHVKPSRAVIVCPACHAQRAPIPGEAICADCVANAAGQEQPFPGYRLIREVGRGAMGLVFLGWSEEGGFPVAMKVIHPAKAFTSVLTERFIREAEILKQLHHPHIVEFREAGQADGVLFLAMEYVHGKSAAAALSTHTRIAERIAVSLTCELLQALEYAHAKRYVHRDLKPANLLLRVSTPGKLGVKLADFGLARVYEASQLSGLTGTNEVGGTTAYMPPEQVLDYRNVKPPADQYSAAACLYALLTGDRVYDQPPAVALQLKQILDEDPVPILERKADISPELAAAIMKALSRDPSDRFADVSAFRSAIQRFKG